MRILVSLLLCFSMYGQESPLYHANSEDICAAIQSLTNISDEQLEEMLAGEDGVISRLAKPFIYPAEKISRSSCESEFKLYIDCFREMRVGLPALIVCAAKKEVLDDEQLIVALRHCRIIAENIAQELEGVDEPALGVDPSEMHPLALEGVHCWLSDTNVLEYPQINLTAVKENENQYDYAKVTVRDKWIIYRDGEESYRYTYTVDESGHVAYILLSNYGGSDSFKTTIKGKYVRKQLTIRENKQVVDVFDIDSAK